MTKPIYTLTPTLARRLAITRQYLAGSRPSSAPAAMLNLVRDLGCVQIDPISAVARSHQLVLWSRLGDYDLKDLDTLLWQERSLFEYWAHCASMVLTEEYPIHQERMLSYESGESGWAQRVRAWMTENAALRETVLEQIRRKGPLASREIEDIAETGWQSSGWTSGRNASRMLDFLWINGTIMVAGRSGLQKLWDLSERCLPAWTPRETWGEDEIVRYAAQKSLRALGVARPQHIQNHYIRGRYPNLGNVLKELEAEGRIVRVAIHDPAASDKQWSGPWYVHGEDLPLLERLERGEWQPRTVLLSPFDNLICDRARTELLFDFFFRIEIYVPKPKRQYGYYVLPILHGDRLIGRIDPLMDRKGQRLMINALHLEPSTQTDAETGAAVANTIRELATFLKAKEIVYPEQVPVEWKGLLSAS